MAETTKIAWCDSTFNGWVGCARISPACDHCYAAVSTPARTLGVQWGVTEERRRTMPANWKQPGIWNRSAFFACPSCGWRGVFNPTGEASYYPCPSCMKTELETARRRVFSASLSDWLDNAAPAVWLADFLDLVRRTPALDWLLLTKRIGNFRKRLESVREHAALVGRPELLVWVDAWLAGQAPAHVWLGATVCNQTEADRDVPKLLATPARVRFLSVEPMLGPIDLAHMEKNGDAYVDALTAWSAEEMSELWGEPTDAHPRIDWVIVGGESGPEARPMHPQWPRLLRDQCLAAGVPFHFKQWGEWSPDETQGRTAWVALDGRGHVDELSPEMVSGSGTTWRLIGRPGKRNSGRLLDGREHAAFPEFAP